MTATETPADLRPCQAEHTEPLIRIVGGIVEPFDAGRDCKYCFIFTTRQNVRDVWNGQGPVLPVRQPQKPAKVPAGEPCFYRGEELSGLEKQRRSLAVLKRWAPCEHPEKPHGEIVCPCAGCHSGCRGYTVEAPSAREPPRPLLIHCMTGLRGSPFAFNAGLFRYRGKLLMPYRTGWAGSQIRIAELDEKYNVLKDTLVPLEHEWSNHGCEDPRLSLFRGGLMLTYTGVRSRGRSVSRTDVIHVQLADDYQPVDYITWTYHDAPPNRWQKNCLPFEHDGELFITYSIKPHVIGHIANGTLHPFTHQEHDLPWSGGFLHGSTPPQLIGDEYVSFFHGAWSNGQKWPNRTYTIGVYTFDAKPPFHIRRMTPRPIMIAPKEGRPDDQICECVFPCGAILEDGRWKVGMGLHDRFSQVVEWSGRDIDIALGPPTWWRFRSQNDRDIYRAVVEEDEYRVGDLTGATVVDLGAHVGSFARAATLAGAAVVHCYEPGHPTRKVLREHAKQMPGVLVLPLAVGDPSTGPHYWTCPEGPNTGAGKVLADYRAQVGADPSLYPVDVIHPDEVIQEAAKASQNGRVRLLKIDTEGHQPGMGEWGFFALVSDTSLALIDRIAGEYHLGGGRVEAIAEQLRGAGFAVEVVATEADRGLFFARKQINCSTAAHPA